MSSAGAPEVILCDTSYLGAVRAASRLPYVSAAWPTKVTYRLASATLAISVITVAEERAGELEAGWKPAPVATADAARRAFLWVPIDADIVERWAVVVADSKKAGIDCKPHHNDVWIAATAIERNLPLVTCDEWQSKLPQLPEAIYLPHGSKPSV